MIEAYFTDDITITTITTDDEGSPVVGAAVAVRGRYVARAAQSRLVQTQTRGQGEESLARVLVPASTAVTLQDRVTINAESREYTVHAITDHVDWNVQYKELSIA